MIERTLGKYTFTYFPREGRGWNLQSWHLHKAQQWEWSIDWDFKSSDWPEEGKLRLTFEKNIGTAEYPWFRTEKSYGGY